MNFGLETAIDSLGRSKPLASRRGAVAIAHKQNQYLILRTFIRGRNCKGRKQGRAGGRKEGGVAEESRESLKLDKVREN